MNNTTEENDIHKDRRLGNVYDIEELKKRDKELLDETLQYFNQNLQDLEDELDRKNEKINTEEIRSILKGMEYLCDDIDSLAEDTIKGGINNSNKIIIDIDVSNCQIRAAKPEIQTFIPNDDVGNNRFWDSVEPDRLNKRQFGELKGNALKKAQDIVNQYGSITTSGNYGSIEIDENDFIPVEKED